MKKTHTTFLIKAAKSEHTKTLAIYLALNFIIIQAIFFPGTAFADCERGNLLSQTTQSEQPAVSVNNTTPTEPTPTPTEPAPTDTTFLKDAPLSPSQNTAQTATSPGTISLNNGHSFVYDTDTTGRFVDQDGNQRAYFDVSEINAQSSPALIPNGDGVIHLGTDEIWLGTYLRDGTLKAIIGKRVDPLALPELSSGVNDITDTKATINATIPLESGQYAYVFLRDQDGNAATYNLQRVGQEVTIPCDGYANTDCIAVLDPAEMENPYQFSGTLSGLKPATTYTYEIRIYREPNSWDVIRSTPPATFQTEGSTREISIETPTAQLSSSGLSAQLTIQFNSNLPYGNLPFGSRIFLKSKSRELGNDGIETEYSQIIYDGTAGGVHGGTWNYIFMPPASSHGDYIIGDLRDSTAYLVNHPNETTTLDYWVTLEWYDWVTVGQAIPHTLSSAVSTITFGGHTNDPPPDPDPNPNPEPEEGYGLFGSMCGGSRPDPPQVNQGSDTVTVDQAGDALFRVGAANILSGQIIRLALMDEGGAYRFFNMMADGSGHYLFNWYLNPLLRYRYYFSVVNSNGVLSQTQERTVEPAPAPAPLGEVSPTMVEVNPTVTPQAAEEPNPKPAANLWSFLQSDDCDPPDDPPQITAPDNAVTIKDGYANFRIGVSNLLSGQIVRLALADESGVFQFYNMIADGYGNYLFNNWYLNRILRYRYYFMVVDSAGNNLAQTQEKVIEPVAPPEASLNVPTLGEVTETTGTVKVNAQLPIGYTLTLKIVSGPTTGEVTMVPDPSVQLETACRAGYVCSSAFTGTLSNLVESSDYQYQVVITDTKGQIVKASDMLWFGTKGIIDDLEALVRHHPATRVPSDTRYNPNYDFNDDHSVDAIDQIMMRNLAGIAKSKPDVFDHIYTKIMAEVESRLGAIRDVERPTGPVYEVELDPNHDGKIDETDREMIKSALIKVRVVMGTATTTPKETSALISEHIDGLPADWKVYAMIQDPSTGEWSKHEMTLPAWQNPKNPLDVDGNGIVEQADAQLVIDRILTIGTGPVDETIVPPPYFDTNGDGRVSPIDSLVVINFLLAGTTTIQSAYQMNLDGLIAGTTYQYHIKAMDGLNQELSKTPVSSFTTLLPTVSLGIPTVAEPTDTTVSVNVNAQLPIGYSLALQIVSGPTSGQVVMVPDHSVVQPLVCVMGYMCNSAFTGTLENLKSSSDYQIQVVMTDKDGKVVKTSAVQNIKTQNPPPAIDLDNPFIGPSGDVEVHAWVPTNYKIRVEVVDGPTDGSTDMILNDGRYYESTGYVYDPGRYEPAICLDGYVCGNNFIGKLENLTPGSDYQVKVRIYDENGKLAKESDALSFRTYDQARDVSTTDIKFNGTSADITVTVDNLVPGHEAYLTLRDPTTDEWAYYELTGTTSDVSNGSSTFKLHLDNLVPGRQYYYSVSAQDHVVQCDSRPSPSSPCMTGQYWLDLNSWFTVPQLLKPVKIDSFHLGPADNGLQWEDRMTLSVTADASGLKDDEKLFVVVKGPGGPFTSNAMLAAPFAPYVYDESPTYSIVYDGYGRFLHNTDYTFTVQKRDAQGKILDETTPTAFHTPPALANTIQIHQDLFMINQCDWPGSSCSYVEVSIPNVPPQSAVFMRVIDETESLRQSLPAQLTTNIYTPLGGGNAATTYKGRVAEFVPGHKYTYYFEVVTTTDGLASELLNATVIAASPRKTFTVAPRMAFASFKELGSFDAKLYGSAAGLMDGEEAIILVKNMQGDVVTYGSEGNFSDGVYYWLTGLSPDTDYTYQFIVRTPWNGWTDMTIGSQIKFHTKPLPTIPIQVEVANIGYIQATFNATIQNMPDSIQTRLVLIDDQFNELIYGLGGGDAGGNFTSTITNLQPGRTYSYQVQVTYVANEMQPSGNWSSRTIIVSKSEIATFTTRSESDPPYIPKPVVEPGMIGSVRVSVDMEAVRNGGILTLHAKNAKTGELYSRSMTAGMTTWTGIFYYSMFSNPNHSMTYGWSEELQQWVYTTSDEFVFWITVDVGGREISASETTSATLNRV